MSFDFVLDLLLYYPNEASDDFSGRLKILNHGKDHVFLPHYPVRYQTSGQQLRFVSSLNLKIRMFLE